MPTAETNYFELVMSYAQSDEIPTPFGYMPRPAKMRGPRYKPLDSIPKIGDQQELITRDQARVILGGISYMTIARLDRAGKLNGIKLNDLTDEHSERPSTSKKLYQKAEVKALAAELRKAAAEKRRKA